MRPAGARGEADGFGPTLGRWAEGPGEGFLSFGRAGLVTSSDGCGTGISPSWDGVTTGEVTDGDSAGPRASSEEICWADTHVGTRKAAAARSDTPIPAAVHVSTGRGGRDPSGPERRRARGVEGVAGVDGVGAPAPCGPGPGAYGPGAGAGAGPCRPGIGACGAPPYGPGPGACGPGICGPGAAAGRTGTVGCPVSRAPTSSAEGRSAGSFDRHAATMSRRGAARSPRSGGEFRIRVITEGIVSAPKAGLPVAANTIVTPQANMSAGAPAVPPESTSGAR
ncbi:hypothetical protein GCM10027612_63250 [Microbispora bryophytorum subsp. camponoti]